MIRPGVSTRVIPSRSCGVSLHRTAPTPSPRAVSRARRVTIVGLVTPIAKLCQKRNYAKLSTVESTRAGSGHPDSRVKEKVT